jgi:hypothetical protein
MPMKGSTPFSRSGNPNGRMSSRLPLGPLAERACEGPQGRDLSPGPTPVLPQSFIPLRRFGKLRSVSEPVERNRHKTRSSFLAISLGLCRRLSKDSVPLQKLRGNRGGSEKTPPETCTSKYNLGIRPFSPSPPLSQVVFGYTGRAHVRTSQHAVSGRHAG